MRKKIAVRVSVLLLQFIFMLLSACVISSNPSTMTVQSVPGVLPVNSTAVESEKQEAYYKFMLGVRSELSKNRDDAQEKYELAVKADPSSPYLHARLASIYAGKSNEDKALEHINFALNSTDVDLKTKVFLADILVKLGWRERAIELYDGVIQEDVNNEDVFLKKGILLFSIHKIDEAEHAFQRSISIRPDLPLAYYHLGNVSINRGNLEDAIKNFERAISGKPDFVPAYISLAKVYEEQRLISKAIEVHRTLFDGLLNPPPLVRSELIRLYLSQQDYEPALLLLEDVLREDPNNLEATLRVGLIYVEQKKFQEASVRMKTIINQRPNDVMVRNYLGLIFEQVGAYDDAIKEYVKVLEIDNQYPDSILNLGYLYYRMKDFSKSVPLLRKSLQLQPQRIDSYLILALSLSHLEKYHDAVTVLEQGVALDAKIPDFHYHLGIVHEKLNQSEALIAHMEKTIDLDPTHSEALNYLGYYYVEREIRLEEAMGLIKRAVSLQPDNGYYVDSLAWANYKMGRTDEAVVQLERAVELVPDDPVIVQHLGEVYLTLGDREAARKAWKRALELDPDNQLLKDAFLKHGFGKPNSKDEI